MKLSEIKKKIDEYFATHTEQEVYNALVRNGAIPEEFPESATIVEGWVVRHANPHCLSVFKRKPDRLSDIWSAFDSNVIALDPTLFPSVTWESEPLKVRITITPIEE